MSSKLQLPVNLQLLVLLLLFVPGIVPGMSQEEESSSDEIELADPLDVLNKSPWARQQTTTRVVSGVGSGEYGEREIFSRYYVRILSAQPVREAYEKVRGLLENSVKGSNDFDFSTLNNPLYVVIGVAFRSNQPDLESEVLNTFRAQTVETLQNRAFLSTPSFPQLRPVAYRKPIEPAVGAQFVFPRIVDGVSVISKEDESFAFELDLPGDNDIPELRVTFPVSDELLPEISDAEQTNGKLNSGTYVFRQEQSASVDLDASRFASMVNLFPQQTGKAFHGSVYLFHRNDNLDARNFFDPVGEPLPEYKRNQFGFSLGAQLGPRLNLFGSFDGLRINQGSTLLSNVPSPAMKSGDFSELLMLEEPIQLHDPFSGESFTGNLIPPDRIHPVTQNLLSLLPSPNRDEEVRNYVNSQPVIHNGNTLNLRGDFGLSEISQLAFQFQLDDRDGIDVHPFPTFGSRELETEYEGSAAYTRTFSDNTVATWRIEVDRTEELDLPRGERPTGLLGSLGIAGVKIEGPEDEGYPVFEVEGYPEFGDEGLPQHEVENRYRFENDLTLSRGSHIFQLSGAIGWRQLNDSRSNSLERGAFGFSGTYSGHAFADFLLGRADQATRTIGSSRQDLRSHDFRIGVTDEWRVLDRLTLTLGLRYHYWSPFSSIRNNLSVFRPLLFEPPPTGELIDLNEGLTEDRVSTVVRPDRNDFAPHIGLAYRPFGSGRFVLRASYSVDYSPFPSYIFEHYMGRNYPYYFQQRSQASVDSSGLDVASPFDTDTPTELTVQDMEPELRTPYSHRWDISLQNEMSDDWTVEFSYRGRRSFKNLREIPANVPAPAPGPIQPRRPNPDYGRFILMTGGANSLFYEFQVDLRRRFANGFTFDTRFEIRRNFNDDLEGSPNNPRNLRAEWGPSEGFSDRRFRLNFIYDLPFGAGRTFGKVPGIDFLTGGWRLSGIASIMTGENFSVRLPGDPNNDGLSNDRPDRLCSGELSGEERSIDRWFDTSAFAQPEAFTFGNAGRGILVGPPYHNWDLSLIKDFMFPNRHRLQFRFAFFNAFNHTNFENPGNILGTRTFGVITAAKRAREIEIAMRYIF